MPRKNRLDSPGTLHHVIIRGIEKRKIVEPHGLTPVAPPLFFSGDIRRSILNYDKSL